MRVNRNPDEPTMFWKFTEEGDADWKADPILTPKITDVRIVFDYPNQHTTRDDYVIRLNKKPDRPWEGGSNNFSYSGTVRTDTDSHVILEGRWAARSGRPVHSERGDFVAVFPKEDE